MFEQARSIFTEHSVMNHFLLEHERQTSAELRIKQAQNCLFRQIWWKRCAVCAAGQAVALVRSPIRQLCHAVPVVNNTVTLERTATCVNCETSIRSRPIFLLVVHNRWDI